MSTVTITVPCPICEDDLEFECEYEPADPEVGIMNGGPIPSDDVPLACPCCEVTFSDAERAQLLKAIETACKDWEPPYDEPDDDDGWWDDSRADQYDSLPDDDGH